MHEMPDREVGLVRGPVAVLVRMLELVERRVLGVEETSISAEEMIVDCADGSRERHSAWGDNPRR